MPVTERTALRAVNASQRLNLPDEADNHIVELAVTGQASWIVSWNVRDLKRGELAFPQVKIGSPVEYLASLNH